MLHLFSSGLAFELHPLRLADQTNLSVKEARKLTQFYMDALVSWSLLCCHSFLINSQEMRFNTWSFIGPISDHL